MCPNEIRGRITSFQNTQKAAHKNSDALAWMVGHYIIWSFHDHHKYPDRPRLVVDDSSLSDIEMDDDTIKDIVTGFAITHNAIERENNGDHA